MSESDPTPALLRGARLFNDRHWWHAHEAWEELWLEAEGDLRTATQGLIQLAAAAYHLERSNIGGATRLLSTAIERLERTSSALPFSVNGPLGSARQALERLRRGELVHHEEISAIDLSFFR
ncbi:MAG TPA: DUF309 domain-containing protein [Thermoanaerobaculia bacterium]|nr:DUF309 domain-containing protein [Thermoanaerobaculia bacterium]